MYIFFKTIENPWKFSDSSVEELDEKNMKIKYDGWTNCCSLHCLFFLFFLNSIDGDDVQAFRVQEFSMLLLENINFEYIYDKVIYIYMYQYISINVIIRMLM